MTVQIKTADTIKQDFIRFLRSAIEANGGPNVTDYNIGSVLNVLVEAFADVLENYYFDLFQITKESLENIYNGFNFYKQPGKKSITTLTIYIDALISELGSTMFSIPRGTLVSTEDGSVTFEIIDDYDPSGMTIATTGEFVGKTQYSVRAMCTESGTAGNVAANSITKFTTAITNTNNVAYWIRNASASGGTDAESEQDMKSRFQKYLISMRRGTQESIEYALTTSAAFTGLMYSISGYRFLNVIVQTSPFFGTNYYDQDRTLQNKFYPSYGLLTDNDASSTDPFYLYIGAEDKFTSLLFSTQNIPLLPDGYELVSPYIEYYNRDTQQWEQITLLNINPANPDEALLIAEQYLSWDLTAISTTWGKFQIRDYSSYFIRLKLQKTGDNIDNFDVYKVMTYPFPGYIDIYCLKNYRDPVSNDDKTLLAEAIDNYKAAGVITTVTDASIVNLHPTIIIHTSNLTNSLVPSDIIDSVRTSVIAFANSKNVGVDFVRNDLYAYLYSRFNQYGNLYIYYKYDPSIYEDLANGIFKEGFRDNVLEASINEKVDLILSDVYVVRNLNVLVNTLRGYQFADNAPNYSDYYKDLGAIDEDLYLAY